MVPKRVIKVDNYDENLAGEKIIRMNPFMLTQSLVVSGSGKAMVLAVGANSRRGHHVVKAFSENEIQTPLQEKLDNVGSHFAKKGLLTSFFIFLAALIFLGVQIYLKNVLWNSTDTLLAVVRAFILMITMVIVSVPEGLPLSVAISLAYSVQRMRTDAILVKNMHAPEIMGGVNEMCTGKTGTITYGDMKVTAFYTQGRLIQNIKKTTLVNCGLLDHVVVKIKEGILWNCEAYLEMKTDKRMEPSGSPTECSLINFLVTNGVNVGDMMNQKQGHIKCVIPFDSTRKRMTTAV